VLQSFIYIKRIIIRRMIATLQPPRTNLQVKNKSHKRESKSSQRSLPFVIGSRNSYVRTGPFCMDASFFRDARTDCERRMPLDTPTMHIVVLSLVGLSKRPSLNLKTFEFLHNKSEDSEHCNSWFVLPVMKFIKCRFLRGGSVAIVIYSSKRSRRNVCRQRTLATVQYSTYTVLRHVLGNSTEA
jgi:hypothetical protein